MDNFEFTVPILVIGGGACGAVAALTAHAEGAEVLLAEQDATPTGTTSMSQGLMCAAGTKAQAAHGIQDDAETFYQDILTKTKGQTDPVIARAIATESGPTLDWLSEEIGYPFDVDLGFRAAYGHTRQRMHGWDGHGGADMIQLLHQKLAERDIPVLTQARLAEIVADDTGRVLGVELERPDGSRDRIGCETLILASGGFAANHDMVAQNMPEAATAKHNGHEGNHGDGITLGAKLGAALADMGSYQGYAMLADPSGITVPPGVIVEGGMLINLKGKRFVDETADIAGMVLPVMAQPEGTVFVVYDAQIEEKTAYTLEVQAMRELGVNRKVASIEALAELTGAPLETLKATLAEALAAAEAGQPDQFGRVWGEDRPPLFPLHVTKVCGAIYHTQGGLQIDGNARVLRADGTALPNLFAGGGAARGVSGPSYWGYLPAMGLGSAITLGHIAGKTAAAQVKGQLAKAS